MAVPAVRSVGAVASGATITALGLPAGWQENDILVIVAETSNENPTTNPPTGWTAAPNLPVGTGTAAAIGALKLFVWWRRATASESTVNFGTTFNHCVARMLAVSGCVLSGDPWHASANNPQTSTTALSFPTITTTLDQTLIVLAAAFDRDAATTANLPALTSTSGAVTNLVEHMDNLVTTGVGGGIGCASGTKAVLGATGTVTGTITASIYHAWTGALIPLADNATPSGNLATVTLSAPGGAATTDVSVGGNLATVALTSPGVAATGGAAAGGEVGTLTVTPVGGSAVGDPPVTYDQILYPTAIVTLSGLVGLVSAIDESVDSPDGSWLTVQ